MKCPFLLPVKLEDNGPGDRELKDKLGSSLCRVWSKHDADYIVHVINSYEKLASELRASDNWLHRLLKSCVILLDDGEVTRRAVEKQSRYNQQALKAEKSND